MGDLCILKLPTMLKAVFPSEGKGQDNDDDDDDDHDHDHDHDHDDHDHDDEISHNVHSVDNHSICTL